jgi:protein-L-isoaspartate(D-aspartate) O-methyltransferase
MVRRQILARGVEDARVLEAFLATPRHLFVDEALSARAYDDGALPIGAGQTISQPFIVARMLQLLAISPEDRILEIGTGSGYQTALLVRLAAEVYTVERVPLLARRARDNWRRAGVEGIQARIGDGSLGWPSEAPFSAIIVSAAAPTVPAALLAQVAPGGRVIAPVGNAVRQVLKVVRRTPSATEVDEHDACSFVRLIGREGFSE